MNKEVANVTITNNTDLVRENLARATNQSLEAIGFAADKYAKEGTPVKFGRLRNSMTHVVQDNSVYVGSNVEYAPYVELGTGIYASDGNGRKGWWVYVVGGDENRQGEKKFYTEQEAKRIAAILRAKGLDAHATNGSKPHHMIRRAVTEHTDEYRNKVKTIFKANE